MPHVRSLPAEVASIFVDRLPMRRLPREQWIARCAFRVDRPIVKLRQLRDDGGFFGPVTLHPYFPAVFWCALYWLPLFHVRLLHVSRSLSTA
jgi:hypothetical protein